MRDRWTWDLLDQDDQQVSSLSTMEADGQITLNLDADVRAAGSFRMREDLDLPVDWLTVRLRPVHTDLDTGESEPWGVFLPVVPATSWTATGRSWSGTLLDKTSILAASGPDQTYVVPAGTPIVARVVSIISEQADDRIAATPSDATVSAEMTWDIQDSPTWLTICNELLKACGYEAVWVDRTGQWRVQPYRLPADRPVEFTFERGPTSVHLPSFDETRDDFSVPNVVTCVGKGSGDDPPLVAVARNDNPASRYSTVARGREIVRRYTSVEAADQAALYAQAQRYLTEESGPGTKIDFTHAIRPLWLGSAVRFQDRGVSSLATVNEMRLQTRAGQLVESKLTEVIAP